MTDSIVYALDFDGVICDSAIETAISGWKAACRLWQEMPPEIPADKLEAFRQIRPIIETGYEAILTMRLLHLGVSTQTLVDDHAGAFRALTQETNVDDNELKHLFGDTRDTWIATDEASWIQKNPLYPGVADKLARLGESHVWYVVTTKQERFVKKILDANHVDLPEERIFGLDRKLSKANVLKQLLQRHPEAAIHFVEDRLLNLLNIRQDPELATVQLAFAEWGYNSEEDKRLAQSHGFRRQSIEAFPG